MSTEPCSRVLYIIKLVQVLFKGSLLDMHPGLFQGPEESCLRKGRHIIGHGRD